MCKDIPRKPLYQRHAPRQYPHGGTKGKLGAAYPVFPVAMILLAVLVAEREVRGQEEPPARQQYREGRQAPAGQKRPTQRLSHKETLSRLRNARFNTGGWVTFARLGGQIAGDSSPHLDRILGEAGATADQRRQICEAYRTGANEAAKRAMDQVLTKEQKAKIGRRTPHEQITEYPLVFAVEKQTFDRYPDARARIESMVEQINNHFRAGGVKRQFSVRSVGVYDKNEDTGCLQPRSSGGKSLPKEYCAHPHDYILVALDEGAGGPHWPCPWLSSIEVHGARTTGTGRTKAMFNPRSAMVLCHELAHLLGLPDFYALNIKKEDNLVNQEEIPSARYDPFQGALMDNLGPFHPWDAEIINREITALPVINHSWIDYQPEDTALKIVDNTGAPLSRAKVNVYRSERDGYYAQTLGNTPEYSGETDANGRFSLGPHVLGVDPFQALRFFLVEIRYEGRVDYQWFSFIDVNFAFWKDRDILITSSL